MSIYILLSRINRQLSTESQVPCCPPLETDNPCDVLTHHYRLTYPTLAGLGNQRQNVRVEVIIRTKLERCSGPLALGDLVYTTTLFPGERVRLFSTDRRTRFTYDKETQLSYRNEQTSEEHFYMASMSDFMSDVSVRDQSSSSSQISGSSEGHGGTSGFFETIFSGPSVEVGGSYNSSSTSSFLRELNHHARSSHYRSEMASRASSAVSIGEVQTRTHVETESESQYESSSRNFSNPNKCHSITYYFYRINKLQTVKFLVESINRRIIDSSADTKVTNNRFVSDGGLSVIPAAVLATNKERLAVEDIGRKSVQAKLQSYTLDPLISSAIATNLRLGLISRKAETPILETIQKQALSNVDKELIAAGLLDRNTNRITEAVRQEYSFEIKSSLPTPGFMVKGCIDDCNVCEPELEEEIKLNIENKKLQNELLKRKTELLEKSQEYRCCPGEKESTEAEQTT